MEHMGHMVHIGMIAFIFGMLLYLFILPRS